MDRKQAEQNQDGVLRPNSHVIAKMKKKAKKKWLYPQYNTFDSNGRLFYSILQVFNYNFLIFLYKGWFFYKLEHVFWKWDCKNKIFKTVTVSQNRHSFGPGAYIYIYTCIITIYYDIYQID